MPEWRILCKKIYFWGTEQFLIITINENNKENKPKD